MATLLFRYRTHGGIFPRHYQRFNGTEVPVKAQGHQFTGIMTTQMTLAFLYLGQGIPISIWLYSFCNCFRRRSAGITARTPGVYIELLSTYINLRLFKIKPPRVVKSVHITCSAVIEKTIGVNCDLSLRVTQRTLSTWTEFCISDLLVFHVQISDSCSLV
jgi:hypothetical protein